MQEIQQLEGYLKNETLKYVSEQMGISSAEIFGVATFYSMFRLKPQGKHVIRVCKGTACHVSGANAILDAIREHLNLEDKEDTTEDAYLMEYIHASKVETYTPHNRIRRFAG